MSTSPYDIIGHGYGRHRRPDPAIERAVGAALGTAGSVLSVGAGTGSYEPSDRLVVAIEPSMVMIGQRPVGSAPPIRAVAEALPVCDYSFDAALAVLTVHHWHDPWLGLSEMRRVARRQVILTFDPVLHCRHWLTEYLPELTDIFAAPAIEQIAAAIEANHVVPLPLPHNTPDGMTIAYWRRPHAYLDPDVRAGSSALQQLPPSTLQHGLQRLEQDLTTGRWADRYGDLLALTEMDYGLRLVFN